MARRKFTKKEKREITKMWQKEFPEMGIGSTMELMNILGPLVIGVYLYPASDGCQYSPVAHIHNLGDNLDFISLTGMIETDFKYISTNSKEDAYLELVEILRKKAFIPFEGNVCIDALQEQLWQYYLNCTFNDKGHLLAAYFDVAVWTEEQAYIERSLARVEKEFEPLYNSRWFRDDEEANTWISTLRDYAKNPETLKENVEKNIIAFKITEIPRRQILY